MVCRLHHDLVGAVHGGEFSLRAHGLFLDAAGGIRGERRGADPGGEPVVEIAARAWRIYEEDRARTKAAELGYAGLRLTKT